ncbi:MAG: ABC transporter substrate-binding protein [Nakamurella sp.]
MKDSPQRRLRIALIAATAVGALALSACGSSSDSTASSTSAGATSAGGSSAAAGGADVDTAKAALIEPGALTVCTSLSYKPFQFTDGDKVVGFDVDLLDLAAAKLGVEQKIIDTPFEGIKSGDAMATGKCDAAAAAMSITPERQKVILFSAPYFDANQALVVPESSTVTDLKGLSGKRIGGQTATTGLDYLKSQQAANGYEIVEYQDFPSQSQSLLTGQIDAAVNDIPVWNQVVTDNAGQVKVVAQFDTGDKYGVGMKLGNDALKSVIDSSIAEAKANGKYDEMYTKWIGTAPPSSSGSASAAPSSN